MAFGTVVKVLDLTTPDVNSAGGMSHTGRGVVVTGTSSTLAYGIAKQAICKAYTVTLLFLHWHFQEGHRNAYAFDAIAGTNKPLRGIGVVANQVRSGDTMDILGHMMGRRTWLGASGQQGQAYDFVNRAVLRAAATAGLTTPLQYCATDRYMYVIHNTNQLVKVDRRNQAIVASCTLPANGSSSDGLCSDDRNLVYACTGNDTLYWLRAA